MESYGHGFRAIETVPSTSIKRIVAQEKLNQKRKRTKFEFVKSYTNYDLYRHKTKRIL